MKQSSTKCYECNKLLYNIQINTNRTWRGNDICDCCWCKYADIRQTMWDRIEIYKSIQCSICLSIKSHNNERYHYDHINMFNKDKSVCSMVNEGVNIEYIYKEIDKCQILCLTCHHIVTYIEHKLGFTRIKMILTKHVNQNEITHEEYTIQSQIYQKLYEEKMNFIYAQLKLRQI